MGRLERELMRGVGPVAVLGLLEQREMYGYELVEALSKRADGVLAMGQSTLYPLLYNLEGKKLIRSKWRVSENGRKRRYYAPTPKGLRWLESRKSQLEDVMAAMKSLGVIGPHTGEC